MTVQTSPLVTPALQHEIEQFLYAEAALLDERRFDAWLALFTPDVDYRVPAARELDAPDDPQAPRLMHFEDDLTGLRLRVGRLASKAAWTEQPPPMTRRAVTNVRVTPGADGELEVRSYFLLYHVRRAPAVDLLAGTRRDTLRRAGAGLQIRRRIVWLDQGTIVINPLSVLF